MGQSFEYVRGNKGLMLQEDYPSGKVQYPCQFNSSKKAVEVENLVYLKSGDEELLKRAVASIGPIAAGIEGGSEDFFTYGGGIFDSKHCTQIINHAVLIVGNDDLEH